MTRFPPLPEESLDDDQRRFAGKAMRTGPYNAFMRAPKMWEALQELRNYTLQESVISRQVREAMMLAIARHWNCDAGFAAHVPLAQAAGLPDEAVDLIARDIAPRDVLSVMDAAAVEACMVLLRDGRIDDEQFASVRDLIGERALIEIVGLVGFFSSICLALNLAGLSNNSEPAKG